MAGEGADDFAAGGYLAVVDVAQRTGQRGGGGRLAEDAFFTRQQALRGEDFRVAAFVEPAAGFFWVTQALSQLCG